jgi:hypothetical protein
MLFQVLSTVVDSDTTCMRPWRSRLHRTRQVPDDCHTLKVLDDMSGAGVANSAMPRCRFASGLRDELVSMTVGFDSWRAWRSVPFWPMLECFWVASKIRCMLLMWCAMHKEGYRGGACIGPGSPGEMKGASVPAVVGVPLPLFLWRFKVGYPLNPFFPPIVMWSVLVLTCKL